MYVYILRSSLRPEKLYVGLTEDVNRRLDEHNTGKSPHTSKFMPWSIETFIWFTNRRKAAAFEQYLKSGSGWAFRTRHF